MAVIKSIILPLQSASVWSKTQSRCYMSNEIKSCLESIAGPGDTMIWWTEDEAIAAITQFHYNWAWIPYGDIDPYLEPHFTNRQTHMKIFFKNPDHALMFKLVWT